MHWISALLGMPCRILQPKSDGPFAGQATAHGESRERHESIRNGTTSSGLIDLHTTESVLEMDEHPPFRLWRRLIETERKQNRPRYCRYQVIVFPGRRN